MGIQQTLLKGYGGAAFDWGGDRGIVAGGLIASSPWYVQQVRYVNIATTGNTSGFGNLASAEAYYSQGCSNGTRGCMGGGYSPSPVAVIDYITMSTEGNATDFGNLTMAKNRLGALGNATRGVFLPGNDPPQWDVIDYITIATANDAVDFGSIDDPRYEITGCASATRGILFGGYGGPGSAPKYAWSKIEYITIANTGNATGFGSLTRKKAKGGACDNDTRGIYAGGSDQTPQTYYNEIDYITIASTGNASDFGDLTQAMNQNGGVNDKTAGVDRGAFGGGYVASPGSAVDTIDYITISTTANAQDFGDLTRTRYYAAACSGGDAS